MPTFADTLEDAQTAYDRGDYATALRLWQPLAKHLTNVAELALSYDLRPHTVLIEHNAIALHQREWAERMLAEGDRIEVVRVVAGG